MEQKKMTDEEIDHTIEEIQAIMNAMEKKTFHSETSMEWEGSIQNAPTGNIEVKE